MKILDRLPQACVLPLIVGCISFNVFAASNKCADLFRSIESEVAGQSIFHADFGAGVYVRKVGATEFRIEPPPVLATSAREAQRQIAELTKPESASSFTILFYGMSVGEVIGFKAMLQRDERFKKDRQLSAVLLSPADTEAKGSPPYGELRERAVTARGVMAQRYAWGEAKVEQVEPASGSSQEAYMLSVDRSNRVDSFLLTLRLRAAQLIRNRSAQIRNVLASSKLANATVEQMVHELVSDLKASDKGITTGTLKVMAGDFIIAQLTPQAR